MNVGQILETHLGWAAHKLGKKSCRAGASQQRRGLHRELMRKEFAGTATLRQLEELDDEMLIRVAGHEERHLVRYRSVDGAREEEIKALLKSADLPHPARRALRRHDGRTVRAAVTVGYIYMLKLCTWLTTRSRAFHRSVLAYHAATAGWQGAVRRQRFGEMEVWALEAYGAAYILQELLTQVRRRYGLPRFTRPSSRRSGH